MNFNHHQQKKWRKKNEDKKKKKIEEKKKARYWCRIEVWNDNFENFVDEHAMWHIICTMLFDFDIICDLIWILFGLAYFFFGEHTINGLISLGDERKRSMAGSCIWREVHLKLNSTLVSNINFLNNTFLSCRG